MLSQRLVPKQIQQLSPQMIFASELLQMSRLELHAHLEQELLENPMLEVEEPATDEKPEPWEEMADDQAYEWPRHAEKRIERDPFDSVMQTGVTLERYLLNQLQFLDLSKDEREIGEFLIGNLDECGLLAIDIDVVADAFWVTPRSVSKLLKMVQTLDPVGIGARDRQECLMIQLKASGRANTLEMTIIKDFWEELKNQKTALIQKALKVSASDVQQAIQQIGQLNPNPGLSVGAGDARSINPDLIVEYIDGQYVVRFNDAYTPRIRISTAYRAILRQSDQYGRKDRTYVRNKLKQAQLLVGHIEQRRQTILKVTAYIVEAQQDFLEKGVQFLKPMTMEEVGVAIGVDGSTVSRAQQGKYVQTPGGILPLKFFFTRTLGAHNGTDVSTTAVKDRLQELIRAEDIHKPVSDEKLTVQLQKEGIAIKRRTVAKYRDALNIPNASVRRKFKTHL